MNSFVPNSASNDPHTGAPNDRWHAVVDQMIKIEQDLLATRSTLENLSIVALGRLSRLVTTQSTAASATDEVTSVQAGALSYLVRKQAEVLRDWAIAEHDYVKRLLIAVQPLISADQFAALWLGLRNSGMTPRVRIRRRAGGRGQVILFSAPARNSDDPPENELPEFADDLSVPRPQRG